MNEFNCNLDISVVMRDVEKSLSPILKAIDRMHEEACVIAALCEGELSETEAAKILGLNVVDMRNVKINVLSRVINGYDLREPSLPGR